MQKARKAQFLKLRGPAETLMIYPQLQREWSGGVLLGIEWPPNGMNLEKTKTLNPKP